MKNRAFCFDLDGTITKEEILPILSREADLYEEMSALTEATIKGIIPFGKSFKLRCKLLSSIPISKIRSIIADISLHDDIVYFIKHNKENCFVITGNLDVWVDDLLSSIGVKGFTSLAYHNNDFISGVQHIIDKGQVICKLRNDFDSIVSIGDGMGDVNMFEQSDIKISYGGVHSPVQTLIELSNYITYSERGLCNLLNTLL